MILYNEFSVLSEEDRNILISNTFEWATNLLRQRLDKSRFIALLVLSFLVEIDEDHSRLSQLSIDLDKLLPIDSIPLLHGIAFLYKRISEVLTNPILPRIIDRCINFLSNRSTPSAIQTAVIILSKLKPISKLSQLTNVLWTAIKFPNQIIQKMAVDLYFLCLEHFPYSDDLSKATMSMSNVCIQANSNISETFGAFLVIKAFIEHDFDIINEKFYDTFHTIVNLLKFNHDPIFFEVFALLCEAHPMKAKVSIERVHEVMESNWDLNDQKTCECYIRIASLFPEEFGEISYNYAQNSCDDSYFQLISVNFGNYSDEAAMIHKFETSNLSIAYIDSAYKFLKYYPHNTFKFISILVSKTNQELESDNPIFAFKLIVKFEDNQIFPFHYYWTPIFESLKDETLPEDDKLERVYALFSILKNDTKKQFDKLFELLFFLQNDSPTLYYKSLKIIDDSLLPLFMNESLRILLASYSYDQTDATYLAIVELFIRLRKISPLSTLNFFIQTFKIIPITFTQYTAYEDKRKMINIWKSVIDGADDLIAPHANYLYKFFLDLISAPQPTIKSFKERANYRKIIKEVISIHISAMKCIEKLVQKPYPYDPQKIVDATIGQLTLYNNESLHIATLNTLRSVFRSFGIVNIDKENLHTKLFNFMKITKSETTLYSILSVLGTIGPLDPLSFHMKHDQGELLPLYDKTKREQCYFDFVMKYLLIQLETSHEYSALLNAALYIFQFDAHKGSEYLSRIINVLEKLLNKGLADSVFHIIRSIILLVEIEIFPYAEKINSILEPYLTVSNFNLQALKALSALVFIMKSTFQSMAIKIFSKVLDILSNDCGFDYELYLLQILTHLVIYCNCSQRLLFKQIEKRALTANLISCYAINFLTQVIIHSPYEELCLPSIRLAIKLLNEKSPIKESAQTLLLILHEKCPIYIPNGIDISNFVKLANICEVTADPYPQRSTPSIVPLSVAEVYVKNNFLQYENNWDNWLLHLSQNLVLCSNSPAIRACHPLLHLWTNFEHRLFPLILISVWEIASEKDREILSTHLSNVAMNNDTPVELLGIFCDAIDAMDRAGYSLFSNPEVAGSIAIRCEHFFRAVRFYERAPITDDDEAFQNSRCQLIRVYSRLQRHEGALGIFAITPKAHNDSSILQELGVWSQARKVYNPDRSESDLIGFIECSSKLEDWDTVMKYSERFNYLTPEAKSAVSIYFAAASTFNDMKNIDQFLQYANKSTPFSCIWQAIVALHMNKIRTAKLFIERGMKLNASNRAPFLSGNYEPALPAIELATFLEEMKDVIDVRENRVPAEKVTALWNSKSDWIKTDVEQLRTLFVVRRLVEMNDHLQIGLSFLDAARKLKALHIYDNSVDRFLRDHDDDERVKLLRAKVRYDRKQCRDFSEILDVIHTAKDPNVYASAVCGYATRIQNPTPELLDLLQTVIVKCPNLVRALKHWTYGNLYCARRYDDIKYANNAINGFSDLIRKHNRPYLHYLCQLCSLCFSYETNFTDVFSSLPPSSIEQIVHQLLAQFDHRSEAVRKSVSEIISKFAENHFQAVAFPLSYMNISENFTPHLSNFLLEMRKKHPQLTAEVRIISKGLLDIAMIDFEMIKFIIENAVDSYERDGNVDEFIKEMQRSFLYFHKEHRGISKEILGRHLINSTIRNIENEIKHSGGQLNWKKIYNDMKSLGKQLRQELDNMQTIDINEIAPELLEKAPFTVACPGFYSASQSNSYPCIKSFSRIVKLIPSAKIPRKIRITGSDGKIYKYLLKGKEDLTLDQRVMQWFSLSNSLLRDDKSGKEKNLTIMRYPIIPLSPLAGMIGWAEGGETLHRLISWYNHMKHPNYTCDASKLLNDFNCPGGNVYAMNLNSLQRLEFYRDYVKITDVTALREAIWIKSPSAEDWFTHKINFERSQGLMSIVGYIIGLGDRHPSNILFMNKSGNIVHIDFSDVFEKAQKRKIYPEKVPFRLTNMIVSVFGASVVEGAFKMTANFVMNLMRRNKSALLAFMDIFAKGLDMGIVMEDFERVKDKLNGSEFEDEKELSVEAQVDRLIKDATNEWNLARMFIGWAPQW